MILARLSVVRLTKRSSPDNTAHRVLSGYAPLRNQNLLRTSTPVLDIVAATEVKKSLVYRFRSNLQTYDTVRAPKWPEQAPEASECLLLHSPTR